jgi:hypothetical protein
VKLKYFFHKLFNWEYWPQWLVYLPIAPVYMYYAIKARTPFFMVAANPSMENGGYIMESKFTIHNQLPLEYVPQTFLANPKLSIALVKATLEERKIPYPFFCKPDVGGKGRGVQRIENESELCYYHEQSPINYLVQAAIPFSCEAGIFYCRMPGQPNGFISGIVHKNDMKVIGDGIKTLQQLIEAVPRYYFQRKFLFEKYRERLTRIIPLGEVIALSHVGNHARGSMFTDKSYLSNPKLQQVFDKISDAYNTFYFGRYDVKFNSWDELSKGKNFMIIELNGSGSEPTHIYDPGKKIWQAWKIILQHWKIMYRIAAQHHKNGVPYLSIKQGRQLLHKEKELAAFYK